MMARSSDSPASLAPTISAGTLSDAEKTSAQLRSLSIAQHRADAADDARSCAPQSSRKMLRGTVGAVRKKRSINTVSSRLDGGRLDQHDQVVEGDEPAPAAVDAEPGEDDQLDQHHPGDRGRQLPAFHRRELSLEADPIAQVVEGGEDRGQRGRAEHRPPGLPQGRGQQRGDAPPRGSG